MKLKTVDGNLTLGSVYKLIVWGWAISWTAFATLILIALILSALITGQLMINGEMVQGRAEIFTALGPMLLLFAVLFPIVITFHAFFFGGFITFGVMIYRRWRPLEVVAT